MKKFVLNYYCDAIVPLYDDEEAPTNRPQYVAAELAEEMLEVLKEAEAFIAKQKWSLEEMIVQTKIQYIIAKAEAG